MRECQEMTVRSADEKHVLNQSLRRNITADSQRPLTEENVIRTYAYSSALCTPFVLVYFIIYI